MGRNSLQKLKLPRTAEIIKKNVTISVVLVLRKLDFLVIYRVQLQINGKIGEAIGGTIRPPHTRRYDKGLFDFPHDFCHYLIVQYWCSFFSLVFSPVHDCVLCCLWTTPGLYKKKLERAKRIYLGNMLLWQPDCIWGLFMTIWQFLGLWSKIFCLFSIQFHF